MLGCKAPNESKIDLCDEIYRKAGYIDSLMSLIINAGDNDLDASTDAMLLAQSCAEEVQKLAMKVLRTK